ncbi:flagellar assembly protein FliH [Nitrosospira briensis]|uniref:flagellar assembly protein FliH n=1 Tax=Nitrosospira briensis TaxID=35799 RepID=UPI0008ECAB1E|nr:flagellar assembly protein FliH [Nitrosospira briensis]SFN71133.1 flagellar assembly protein FliH [Nitrosospira briensis]
MTSQIIPKARLSTCQRWEMDAFEPAPEFVSDSCAGKPDDPGESGDALILPTVEQIERIHQQARQEGYAAGNEAGFEAGHELGRRAGDEQATAEVIKLQELFCGFQRELAHANRAVSNDLLTLALCLAKQMVREALRVKPELMLAVVRECIQQETAFNQPAQLFLHPDDAALVRQHLNHELGDCKVSIDTTLERGGCRIKVGNSHTDAKLATRWQRIAQALGQNSNWLDQVT